MKQHHSSNLHTMTGGVALNTQRGSGLEQPPLPLKGTPPTLIFPLSSNYCHYTPIISTGEKVFAGQAIAQAVLKANQSNLKPQLLHTGLPGIARIQKNNIIIEVTNDDSSQTTHQHRSDQQAPNQQAPNQTPSVQTAEELQQHLCTMGILGLGGAMFPTGQKLKNQGIHTLLVNGVECEPILTADACLMTHYPLHIIHGIQQLLQILHIPRALFAIEADKPLALHTMKASLHDTITNPAKIELQTIPSRYPSGGSRQLYEQIFGRRLKGNEHSIQKGVLTLNVHTVAAISDALKGKPLTHRLVTIAGQAINNPHNLWLPIGTPLSWIQKQLQAPQLSTDSTDIIFGGPLMGKPITNTEEPIRAGTAAVLFQQKKEIQERPCIQCGDCNPVCPEALQPQALVQFIHAKQVQQHNPTADQALEDFNLNDCILCGACDLVCPSSIPLATYFKSEQQNQNNNRERIANAERAKQNYEARQARLAQPPRANPPMPVNKAQAVKAQATKIKKARPAIQPTTRLKTQLAKAQRLHREAASALEQAKKKKLDEITLAQYQERVHQMQLKAEAAQQAFHQAQSTD